MTKVRFVHFYSDELTYLMILFKRATLNSTTSNLAQVHRVVVVAKRIVLTEEARLVHLAKTRAVGVARLTQTITTLKIKARI